MLNPNTSHRSGHRFPATHYYKLEQRAKKDLNPFDNQFPTK